MAYWQLEPFGSQFREYLAALVASVVAEVNRNRKKRGKAFGPDDFMQEWGKEPERAQTPQDMFEFVKAFQANLEMKAGLRGPDDLEGPGLVDPHGRPVK